MTSDKEQERAVTAGAPSCSAAAPGVLPPGPASQDVECAAALLRDADRVLVGAGAGLSAAAGLVYEGERFERNFAPFIAMYGLTDMYTAGFYPFPSEEARWAYWARHVWTNRHEPPALPLYQALWEYARDRDCFVVTTNVDGQFEKAGFPPERVFATQGDYGLNQCARGCHDTLYPNRALAAEMIAQTEDCLVPSALVPRCPVCGGPMAVHLRVDGHFVENVDWHAAQDRYLRFVEDMRGRPTVLLELGVGWNTPGIIRLPFEALARAVYAPLVRLNRDDARIADAGVRRGVELQGDVAALWPLLAGAE